MIAVLWLIIFIAFIIWYYIKVGRKAYYLRNFPGVPTYPIIGNINIVMNGLKIAEDIRSRGLIILESFCEHIFHKEKIFVAWIGWKPWIILFNHEYVEEVFSSNEMIDKPSIYDHFKPWLGKGLFTSSGSKWRSRNKFAKPIFHLRITEYIIPLINKQSMILVEKLAKIEKCEIITKLFTLCTLDIICEIAMGVKINAQNNMHSDYVKALHFLGKASTYRTLNILGWFDYIFYRTNYGKEYLKQIKVFHKLATDAIKNRKLELISYKSDENKAHKDNDLVYGRKKKLQFIDYLIESQSLNDLTDDEIRDELSSFVFAGHDTTAMNISWSLYLIGLYPSIQQKIHEELDNVFDENKTRHITNDDLKQLIYLECCIKESLRLYPSVPMIARTNKKDFNLKNYMIPKGSTLLVFILGLHKNSIIFPQPEAFNPERFLPGNTSRLHPYAYIPFSAGPRNCMGQRLAMIEDIIVIANILRNFKITSVDQRDKVIYEFGVVLRPKDQIRIICTTR